MIERTQELQVFTPGQKPIDRPFLRDISNEGPDSVRFTHSVVPHHGGRSRSGVQQRNQGAQSCALPRAVRSQQAENLSGVDREREVIDSFMAVIDFTETVDVDSDRTIH